MTIKEVAETSVLRWWNVAGRNSFPNAKRIYITCGAGAADGGGSLSGPSVGIREKSPEKG